jgi:hypothetical protein
MRDDEWQLAVFLSVLEIARREQPGDHVMGCKLYDPDRDEEHEIASVADGIVTVINRSGLTKHFSGSRLTQFLVILPSNSPLWRYRGNLLTSLDAKQVLVAELDEIGLPASLELDLHDLQDLLAIARTSFHSTTGEIRHRAYAILKKMEGKPESQARAFRAGRNLTEKWNEQCGPLQPADLLIHLAYYRRWTRATKAAIEASDCLDGPRRRVDLSDHDRCILATERAAAFMDLFKQQGVGLNEAGYYLRYSAGANGGKDTEHNRNTRMRYDALRGT